MRTLWCPWFGLQGNWVWHWRTSCPSLEIAATKCSCRFILHNICKIRPFLTQEAVQVLVQTLVISCLDYYIQPLAGVPACTIQPLQFIQNAVARLAYPSFPIPHHSSTPCSGYRWLLESDYRHWYLPTVLWMAQAHPTSRTWSNHTPQPICCALLLPISLLLRHYEAGSATAQENHESLLSWLQNGGTSSETSCVQTAPWTISLSLVISKFLFLFHLMKLMYLHNSCNFWVVSI